MDSTSQGVFVVVEGTDGSGKGTQFELLAKRLAAAGHRVACFDFPQYDEASSYFVRQYLNGAYGTAEEVGPYTGSLFYALDRYEAAPQIRQALAEGKIVLANRFVGSNMAHQGTKFANAEERRGYFIWLDNLEFEMLRIPRPTVSFVLRMPAEISQQLVDQKGERSYTDKKRDLHEADLSHLKQALNVYDDITQLFPRDFVRIDCVRDGEVMDINTINDLLWQKIEPILPPPAAQSETQKADESSGAKTTEEVVEAITVHNPYISKNEKDEWDLTDKGKAFLDEAVTAPAGDAYAFSNALDPATIAAAFVRLSSRGDLRTVVLDEFADRPDAVSNALRRAVAQNGEAVQQLASRYIVVENASGLLAKQLTRGRLAAYVEQSSGAIAYDQKDSSGNYKYHTPDHFDARTHEMYTTYMDQIFDLYTTMFQKLRAYLARESATPSAQQDTDWEKAIDSKARTCLQAALPVASTSTVGIFASVQALEGLLARLQSEDLPEARTCGRNLAAELRKTVDDFLQPDNAPDEDTSHAAYRSNTRQAVEQLAEEYLPVSHAAQAASAVELTSVWPRNELDLVPDMLFEHSSLSLTELQTEVSQWPYTQKLHVFEAYMGERHDRQQRPGRALEKAHYSWDIVCDYLTASSLQRHQMADDPAWQELTPRFGFDTPKLISDAGLDDQYALCFDLSLRLYSMLQQAGYRLEAQYATLLGHKLRCKLTYNAREAFHLLELPVSSPGYRTILRHMHQKLTEIHPLLAEAMTFAAETVEP